MVPPLFNRRRYANPTTTNGFQCILSSPCLGTVVVSHIICFVYSSTFHQSVLRPSFDDTRLRSREWRFSFRWCMCIYTPTGTAGTKLFYCAASKHCNTNQLRWEKHRHEIYSSYASEQLTTEFLVMMVKQPFPATNPKPGHANTINYLSASPLNHRHTRSHRK